MHFSSVHELISDEDAMYNYDTMMAEQDYDDDSFTLTEDNIDILPSDSQIGEEEDVNMEDVDTIHLTAKDSLEVVAKRSSSLVGMSVRSLTNLLNVVIQGLSSGQIKVHDVHKLASCAQGLASNISPLSSGTQTPVTQVTSLERVSTTSLLADMAVKETLHKVRDEFEKRRSDTSVTAEQAVETTLRKIMVELQSAYPEIGIPLSQTSSLVAEETVTATLNKILGLPCSSNLSQRSSEYASVVVNDTLNKIFAEIKESQTKLIPRHTTSTGLADETVCSTLNKVLGDLKAESKSKSQKHIGSASSITTTTIYAEQIVRDMLGKVTKDLQSGTVETGDIEVYAITAQILSEAMRDNDISTSQVPNSRQTSELTQGAVVETLDKILGEVRNADQYPQPSVSEKSSNTSTVIADQAVTATLDKVLAELTNGDVNARDVRSLTAAIVTSHEALRKLSSESNTSGHERKDVCSKESDLANKVVTATLETVLYQLDTEKMSSEDIQNLSTIIKTSLDSMDQTTQTTGQLPKAETHLGIEGHEKTTSFAETFVRSTLERVLQDVAQSGSESLTAAVIASHILTSSSAQNLHDKLRVDKKKSSEKSLTSITGKKHDMCSALDVLAHDTVEKVIERVLQNRVSEADIKEIAEEMAESIDAAVETVTTKIGHNAHIIAVDKVESESEVIAEIAIEDDEGHLFIVDTHGEVFDESDLEHECEHDEVPIVPCVDGKDLHINPDVVGCALGAISCRDGLTAQNSDSPVTRNSFRSLIHPDLSRTKTLAHETEDSIRKQLLITSHHNVVASHHRVTHSDGILLQGIGSNPQVPSSPSAPAALATKDSSTSGDVELVVATEDPAIEVTKITESTEKVIAVHTEKSTQKIPKKQDSRTARKVSNTGPVYATGSRQSIGSKSSKSSVRSKNLSPKTSLGSSVGKSASNTNKSPGTITTTSKTSGQNVIKSGSTASGKGMTGTQSKTGPSPLKNATLASAKAASTQSIVKSGSGLSSKAPLISKSKSGQSPIKNSSTLSGKSATSPQKTLSTASSKTTPITSASLGQATGTATAKKSTIAGHKSVPAMKAGDRPLQKSTAKSVAYIETDKKTKTTSATSSTATRTSSEIKRQQTSTSKVTPRLSQKSVKQSSQQSVASKKSVDDNTKESAPVTTLPTTEPPMPAAAEDELLSIELGKEPQIAESLTSAHGLEDAYPREVDTNIELESIASGSLQGEPLEPEDETYEVRSVCGSLTAVVRVHSSSKSLNIKGQQSAASIQSVQSEVSASNESRRVRSKDSLGARKVTSSDGPNARRSAGDITAGHSSEGESKLQQRSSATGNVTSKSSKGSMVCIVCS